MSVWAKLSNDYIGESGLTVSLIDTDDAMARMIEKTERSPSYSDRWASNCRNGVSQLATITGQEGGQPRALVFLSVTEGVVRAYIELTAFDWSSTTAREINALVSEYCDSINSGRIKTLMEISENGFTPKLPKEDSWDAARRIYAEQRVSPFAAFTQAHIGQNVYLAPPVIEEINEANSWVPMTAIANIYDSNITIHPVSNKIDLQKLGVLTGSSLADPSISATATQFCQLGKIQFVKIAKTRVFGDESEPGVLGFAEFRVIGGQVVPVKIHGTESQSGSFEAREMSKAIQQYARSINGEHLDIAMKLGSSTFLVAGALAERVDQLGIDVATYSWDRPVAVAAADQVEPDTDDEHEESTLFLTEDGDTYERDQVAEDPANPGLWLAIKDGRYVAVEPIDREFALVENEITNERSHFPARDTGYVIPGFPFVSDPFIAQPLRWEALTADFVAPNGLVVSPVTDEETMRQMGIEFKSALSSMHHMFASKCVRGDSQVVRIFNVDGPLPVMVSNAELHSYSGVFGAEFNRCLLNYDAPEASHQALTAYCDAVNNQTIELNGTIATHRIEFDEPQPGMRR